MRFLSIGSSSVTIPYWCSTSKNIGFNQMVQWPEHRNLVAVRGWETATFDTPPMMPRLISE